jgi:hypothetical protein
MKKIIGSSMLLLLAGCSGNPVNTTMYNLHEIRGKEVICYQQEEATRLVKMGFTAKGKAQQAIILGNSMKHSKCKVVDEQEVKRTGDIVIFPITDEFPESFRGVKKAVYKVNYENNSYWLVPTGTPAE